MGIFAGLKRNWTYLTGVLGVLRQVGEFPPDSTRNIATELEAAVDAYPNNLAFVFEGRGGTYLELDRLANRVAHWAASEGLTRGDTVALFMENRPEYVAVWYGLLKRGLLVALINSNLTGAALAHCVRLVNARACVLAADMIPAWGTSGVGSDVPGFALDGAGGEPGAAVADLRPLLAEMPDTRPDPAAREGVLAKETALYIYTSGTTGMPKAARITHARALGLMKSFIAPSNITARDRVYLTLPLYHATGGMCGAGAALFSGATIILRRKFSATHFWAEAIAERATVFVYIGELCRYLVNLPPSPQETQHSLRTCFGNGLRPDVWARFTQRTGIKRIVEFYGSTEGNVSMANLDHRPGAVGAIPRFMRNRFPMRIIRFDVDAEAPVRGPDGLCIEAAPGEAGEAVGEIRSDEARFRFEGYSDPAQTEKKVLRNVFAAGDMWFRTGDLMMQDADTYFYFVDRIGDTFRWKGENVSTNEVAEVLTGDPAVAFANVYGVQIPGADGRAGMAALVVNEGFDLASLHTRIQRELPAYARPLFIRIQTDVDATGTLKLKKVDLVREGYDLNAVNDPIYFSSPEVNGFTALTPEIILRLERGELRV